jgi:hypothetical protein
VCEPARLRQLGDREILDGVADFDFPLLTGGGRDDFLELHDALTHREVECRRLSLDDLNALLLFLIPDADHPQFGGPRRHTA